MTNKPKLDLAALRKAVKSASETKFLSRSKDRFLSSWFFLNHWDPNEPGFWHLYLILADKHISLFSIGPRKLAREIYRAFFGNTPLLKNFEKLSDERDNLLISWCLKKTDVKSDAYFCGLLGEELNHWQYLPWICGHDLHEEDSSLVRVSQEKLWFRPFWALWLVIVAIFQGRTHVLDTFWFLNEHYINGQIAVAQLKRHMKRKNFRALMMPYEGLPYQLALFSHFQKHGCKVYGYAHSSITNFPIHYLKKEGSCDYILTHSSSAKRLFSEELGWDESKVLLTNSFRYKKKFDPSQAQEIALPYYFENPDVVFENFMSALELLKLDLSDRKARIHPVRREDPQHIQFAKRINEALLNTKGKLGANPGLSKAELYLSIGFSTLIFEALEQGLTACQVTLTGIEMQFSPDIWRELNFIQNSDRFQIYSLNTKGALIQYGVSSINDFLVR